MIQPHSSSFTLYTVMLLLVVAGVFLLLREFYCWYFKINEIVKLLQAMQEDSEFIAKEIRHPRLPAPMLLPPVVAQKEPRDTQSIECPSCKAKWTVPSGMLGEGSRISCPTCGQKLEM